MLPLKSPPQLPNPMPRLALSPTLTSTMPILATPIFSSPSVTLSLMPTSSEFVNPLLLFCKRAMNASTSVLEKLENLETGNVEEEYLSSTLHYQILSSTFQEYYLPQNIFPKMKRRRSSEKKKKMSMIPHFFGRRSNIFDPPGPFPLGAFAGLARPTFGIGPHFPPETASFVRADVDWKETPTAHVYRAEVPGLKKEDMKVTVEDGDFLHIRGDRGRHEEESADGWHRMEQSSGSFSRRFRLPENAKVDHISAVMNSGVLTVTVPKAEQPKRTTTRIIEISDK